MKFQLLALALALTGAAAFTRTPMSMATHTSLPRYAGPPVGGTQTPQTSSSIAKYAGPPVKDQTQWGFRYGNGDNATPAPLGGSGRGIEYDRVTQTDPTLVAEPESQMGFRYGRGSSALRPLGGSGNGFARDNTQSQSQTRSADVTRDSFTYGSRSMVRTPPTPLGGSGNGIARDYTQSQTQTRSAEVTRDSFKYGSRSTTAPLKPLGGINPF